jgi:hypothetical protein
MPISITQRLERYFVRVLESDDYSHKQKLEAARYLAELKLANARAQSEKTPKSSVLG